MSKLSHLIQQAKNSRRINDMFKTETLTFKPMEGTAPEIEGDLDLRLAQLEQILFTDDQELLFLHQQCDIISELSQIAEALK